MLAAICDDCAEDLNLLKSYVEKYCSAHSLNIKIHTFPDINSLDRALKSDSYDILFLDIYVNENSGVKYAETIQNIFTGSLFFVTSSMDFAVDAFRLKAVHYLVKPITCDQVYECFSRIKTTLPTHYLEITSNYNTIRIPENLIQYIESYANTVIIHTAAQSFSTHESLENVYSQLNSSYFIRPYRSYIVNMQYINDLSKGQITLKDGTQLLIARQKKKEIQTQYNQFLFDQIRSL